MLGSSLARAVGGAPGAAALMRYLERAEAAGRALTRTLTLTRTRTLPLTLALILTLTLT